MSKEIDPTIGQRLRYLRYQRNWTKLKLAETANVPLTTISLVERGLRSGEGLSLATIRRLAQALGISVEDLIALDDVPDGEGLPAARKSYEVEACQ
jgi:transcriptional regulator with XRE-family HTH domain